MDTKHRYRLLIYFAALVLCLSVCFANAEELQPATSSSGQQAMARQTVIFESAHGHSAFMPVLQQSFVAPSMGAESAVAADAHVVPQGVLEQVTEANRSHHFWHGSSRHRISLIVDHRASLSTGVDHGAERATNASQSE